MEHLQQKHRGGKGPSPKKAPSLPHQCTNNEQEEWVQSGAGDGREAFRSQKSYSPGPSSGPLIHGCECQPTRSLLYCRWEGFLELKATSCMGVPPSEASLWSKLLHVASDHWHLVGPAQSKWDPAKALPAATERVSQATRRAQEQIAPCYSTPPPGQTLCARALERQDEQHPGHETRIHLF